MTRTHLAVALLLLTLGAGFVALQLSHGPRRPERPFPRSAQAASVGGARLQQAAYFGPRRPALLGTVGLTDVNVSVFALNADNTWAGLPNAAGGRSFICYSYNPPINYTYGFWDFDPRIPAVNFYGPDRAPLVTLNGFDPRFAAPQAGSTSGWHCGPAPNWSFIP